MLLVDFKQAFDSINKAKICKIFDDIRIPKKLTYLVIMTLKGTRVARMLIQGTTTKDFEIRSGIKQGDELSTTTFNLILHYAIKDLLYFIIYNGGYT